MWDGLESSLLELLDALHECNDYCLSAGLSQPYTRTQLQVADCISLLFSKAYLNGSAHPTIQLLKVPQITITREIESIQLSKQLSIPRMFNGLWQMSSPAWGSASAQKMDEALLELASQGLVAADMADHYVSLQISELMARAMRRSYMEPSATVCRKNGLRRSSARPSGASLHLCRSKWTRSLYLPPWRSDAGAWADGLSFCR